MVTRAKKINKARVNIFENYIPGSDIKGLGEKMKNF